MNAAINVEERVALAKEDKSLAELGVRELTRQVIASVQNAFVDVQQARESLNRAGNLKSLESIVTINEARLKSGDLAAGGTRQITCGGAPIPHRSSAGTAPDSIRQRFNFSR